MECPQCGLTNPHSAQTCDCGYHFAAGPQRKVHEGIARVQLSPIAPALDEIARCSSEERDWLSLRSVRKAVYLENLSAPLQMLGLSMLFLIPVPIMLLFHITGLDRPVVICFGVLTTVGVIGLPLSLIALCTSFMLPNLRTPQKSVSAFVSNMDKGHFVKAHACLGNRARDCFPQSNTLKSYWTASLLRVEKELGYTIGASESRREFFVVGEASIKDTAQDVAVVTIPLTIKKAVSGQTREQTDASVFVLTLPVIRGGKRWYVHVFEVQDLAKEHQ